MIRDTSLDAYSALKPFPAQQAKILDMISRRGRPMTRGEIAAMTGIGINAVSGRCNELVRSGVLVELGRRPCRVSGRSCYELALPPVQLSLVA